MTRSIRPYWTRLAAISTLCFALLLSLLTLPVSASEREQVAALVQELDYLIEVAEQMQRDAKQRRSSPTHRISFNYPALLEQLRLTRNRTAEFLNGDRGSIQRSAPRPLASPLMEIR